MAKTNLKLKIKRDVEETAHYRISKAELITARLRSAENSKAALAVADKISACCSIENYFIGRDLHGQDGECFDGAGTLWRCNEMLCPSCLTVRRKRTEKKLIVEAEKQKLFVGETWKFVTLTGAKIANVPLLELIEVYNRAFELLRKRKYFKQVIRGGAKGIEFTLGRTNGEKWRFESHGYHVHLHLLTVAKWIDWQELGENWTQCLEKAMSEYGHQLTFATSHGRAVIDIRVVKPKVSGNFSGQISQLGAIREVAKYVTKSDSWLQIPDAQLIEVAKVERWGRMFEMFGEMRHSNILLSRTVPESGAHESERKSENLSNSAYVHTNNINDGETSESSAGKTSVAFHTLKQAALELPREQWLAYLNRTVAKTRFYRKKQLLEKYPYALLYTLNGQLFLSD
jgi:hypothetical protein